MPAALHRAPPLEVCAWTNTPPLTLEALRGKVVMLHVFQLHCPACVELATPQAQRVHERFASSGVIVLGLHSVFERHDEADAAALDRYLKEARLTFPIGIDTPDVHDGIPLTMRAYQLDGTPSTVLIDAAGRLRMKRLGHMSDLELGAALGRLLHEASGSSERAH
jgi:thiol-disulfide isomerase/thioredoxin